MSPSVQPSVGRSVCHKSGKFHFHAPIGTLVLYLATIKAESIKIGDDGSGYIYWSSRYAKSVGTIILKNNFAMPPLLLFDALMQLNFHKIL